MYGGKIILLHKFLDSSNSQRNTYLELYLVKMNKIKKKKVLSPGSRSPLTLFRAKCAAQWFSRLGLKATGTDQIDMRIVINT